MLIAKLFPLFSYQQTEQIARQNDFKGKKGAGGRGGGVFCGGIFGFFLAFLKLKLLLNYLKVFSFFLFVCFFIFR